MDYPLRQESDLCKEMSISGDSTVFFLYGQCKSLLNN